MSGCSPTRTRSCRARPGSSSPDPGRMDRRCRSPPPTSGPARRIGAPWAIALGMQGERHIYFVAETKGSMVSEDLRATERQKIESASAYFRDVADKVTFSQIDSFGALMQAIS
ncbi:MAG: restriction endonuclease [Caulobacteraceae bacterium]